MNKHFSLLLHSALIVGALLPISPIGSVISTQSSVDQPSVIPAATSSDPLDFLAYGSGIPQYRGGGGTR